MAAKGYFIQYKFIIPDHMSHSNYTYQKLFRAMYGYTQTVTKSNGKKYSYHRKGVLSDFPYVKQGKNCVIIPQEAFSQLKNFFLTGSNPAHRWRVKGDWKAVYYLNEKDIDDSLVVKALETQLDRTYVSGNDKSHQKVEDELQKLLQVEQENKQVDETYRKSVLDEASNVAQTPMFRQHYTKSERLLEFARVLKTLRK